MLTIADDEEPWPSPSPLLQGAGFVAFMAEHGQQGLDKVRFGEEADMDPTNSKLLAIGRWTVTHTRQLATRTISASALSAQSRAFFRPAAAAFSVYDRKPAGVCRLNGQIEPIGFARQDGGF